jgi:predicted SAM-dependent methyltransferase
VRSKASQSIKQRIANNGKVRIAVGEVDYKDNASWLDTTIQVLDITCRGDYEKLFGNAAVVSAFKAEHVLEHLTLSEVLVGLRLMNQYLIPGGSLRIAVPTDLIAQCAYNGTSSDNTNAVETAVACKQAVVDKDESEKHKLQFTVASLSTILKTCGYNDITVVENVEENGQFFTTVEEGVDQTERGNIHRSMFESSTPKSIIIDAFKDKEAIVESDSRINAELSSVSNL